MTVEDVFAMIDALSSDERVIVYHALLEELEKDVRPCIAEMSDEAITIGNARPSDDSGKESL
jgi:hypothetical protein